MDLKGIRRREIRELIMYRPIMLKAFKNYNGSQLKKDLLSGIIVAIIAFPLSIALAIASGMRPEQGIYTAIIGAVAASFLGGSTVAISGVTAATVMTVFSIVSEFGFAGLAIATMLAGVILIVMGICKVGELLPYIPYSVTLAFTASIGVGIFMGQVKNFMGMDIEKLSVNNIGRILAYIKYFNTTDITTVIIGIVAIIILWVTPKFIKLIPASFITIIITTLAVEFLNLEVATINSAYGDIPSKFPSITIPKIDITMIFDLLPSAFTLATLIAIVSLLSCVVTDAIVDRKHDQNAELIGQGIANIFCGLFGAVPIAGAVARSTESCKNGGRTPIVALVHSVILAIVLVCFIPLAGYIPMVSLAAILMIVAINMCNISAIKMIVTKATKTDAIIFLITLVAGVFLDLLTAFALGFIASSFLFMRRMAHVTKVSGWKYVEDASKISELDKDKKLMPVPKNTLVYEITGPMFFAASNFIDYISIEEDTKVLILRMRSVPALDITALNSLRKLVGMYEEKGIFIIFSHVLKQPLEMMIKNGFYNEVGENHFALNIKMALDRAEDISKKG